MKPTKNNLNIYSLTFRLPIIIWQLIFFVGPVLFMVAMSFFLVKNYRMTEAFEFINWTKMFSKTIFGIATGLLLLLQELVHYLQC